MNILLTCAGRRHYLTQYFREFLKGRGLLVGADLSNLASALGGCDRAYITPAVTDPAYLSILIEICNQNSIDYVFSLNDLELQLLADNKKYLHERTAAKFVVSSSSAIRCCSDKFSTFKFCERIGVKTPKTYIDIDSIKAALRAKIIKFPIMIKPRWGSASIGLFKCDNIADLEANFFRCRESISDSALRNHGDISDAVIAQEFIEGVEFGVDILNSLEGKLIGFAAKQKLAMRSGETDKSVTVSPKPFERIAQLISQHLIHVGNLDCDFIERDGSLYLLEMNPRFGGGYPFTHMAGANHIAQLLSTAEDRDSNQYSYAINKLYAKCDILVDLSNIKTSVVEL